MTISRVAPPPRTAGARYYAWLYTPAAARDGSAALLAIEHEIMASARTSVDHSVAHVRLDWWQEETERLCAAVPVHPAAIAAREAFLAAGLSAPDLRPLPELAARALAQATLARELSSEDVSDDAALWAEGLLRPLAALAFAFGAVPPGAAPSRTASDEGTVTALGRALHAHERAPTTGTHVALHEALRALPAALAPSLRGVVVWATLALRAPRSGATRAGYFAENWTAWRAARRAQRRPPPRIAA